VMAEIVLEQWHTDRNCLVRSNFKSGSPSTSIIAGSFVSFSASQDELDIKG
jgi:hypothetical protein